MFTKLNTTVQKSCCHVRSRGVLTITIPLLVARGLSVRPALPQQPPAGWVLHSRGPVLHRSSAWWGGEDEDGRGRHGQWGVQDLFTGERPQEEEEDVGAAGGYFYMLLPNSVWIQALCMCFQQPSGNMDDSGFFSIQVSSSAFLVIGSNRSISQECQ